MPAKLTESRSGLNKLQPVNSFVSLTGFFVVDTLLSFLYTCIINKWISCIAGTAGTSQAFRLLFTI